MKKITKREIIAFLLGIIFCFIINMMFNWKENVSDFKKGFTEGYNSAKTEKLN